MENNLLLVVRGAPYGNQNAAGPHNMADVDWLWRHDTWKQELTDAQKGASNVYSHDSQDINRVLRGQSLFEPKQRASTLRTIKTLIGSMRPLDRDATLYRFTANYPHKVGDVYKSKGFVSTTANAIHYAATQALSYDKVLRIHVPKGTPVAYGSFGDTYGYPEKEVILPPWSHFKVTNEGGTFNDRYPMYDLEYLPTKGKK